MPRWPMRKIKGTGLEASDGGWACPVCACREKYSVIIANHDYWICTECGIPRLSAYEQWVAKRPRGLQGKKGER